MEGSERMANTQLIDCPSCGAKNRVPLSKIAQGLQPSCGRCKQPLPLDSKPVTVTDRTFASVVEHSPLPVLLDMTLLSCKDSRNCAIRLVVNQQNSFIRLRARFVTKSCFDPRR